MLFPQKACDQGSAARTCYICNSDADIENRQDQCCARNHVRVVCPADIEGVRHVVDQDDELGDDGRNSHGRQRLRNRHLFKEISAFFFFLLYKSLLPK